MKRIFNALFGRFICAITDHDRVLDSVMRCRNGKTIVYWTCTRCGTNNYKDKDAPIGNG
jgi:hypothetical protein